MPCTVHWLGKIDYDRAWHLQKEMVTRRVKGEIEDALLLLEHPPTITVGKSGRLENVLVPVEELQARGIAFFFTDRGGDVTYHGPGQLVGYPIIDLKQAKKDAHEYLFSLEEIIIRTLSSLSVPAERDLGHAGVWVRGQEIAAIGLAIKRGVTMHGFALNVNTGLEGFDCINPCGVVGGKATSVQKILGHAVPMENVIDTLVSHFAEVLAANSCEALCMTQSFI